MGWRIRTVFILAVAILAAAGVWLHISDTPRSGNNAVGGLVTNADVGGPFSLTDHRGESFGLDDLAGRYALIYFGYTFCPDVCPTELGKVAAAIDFLGPDGDRVTPVMITIDPERDSPAVLREYVPLFHERLVGLTGTPEEIRSVAQKYRTFYRKADSAEFSEYLMDHSSFLYLLSPDGSVIALFGYNTSAEDLSAAIRQHMQS